MPNLNIKLSEDDLKQLKQCKPTGFTWRQYILNATWFEARVRADPVTEFNENWQIHPPIKIEKPCHSCGYCPYGQTVESFPYTIPHNEQSCRVFGHDCPVFRLAEPLSE